MAIPQLPISRDRIADFCRRWKVAELSFFGSVMREDFRPDSDVDVLVSFAPGADWSLFDLVTMQDELTTLVGRPVDLVEEAALRNPYRRTAIRRSKHVLYAA
ncbi:MAG: nucleotidyltransferase family protein [Gemmatimonadetes bacterium]|nr:nucleotidyltransferase family protein [Gemmatimonadota bacterium]